MHYFVEKCVLAFLFCFCCFLFVFFPKIRLENVSHMNGRSVQNICNLPKVHLRTTSREVCGAIRVPLVDPGQAIKSDCWGTYNVTGGRS